MKFNPNFVNGYIVFCCAGALIGHFAAGTMLVGAIIGLLLWSAYGFIFG